jgi:serine/threonine protein kinase
LSKQLDQWKRCNHVNVVPFLGVEPRQGNLPSIVTPYYENGPVLQYLSANPTVDKLYLVNAPLHEDYNKIDLSFQINGIAAAVGYLHSLNPPIIHGDIRGVRPLTLRALVMDLLTLVLVECSRGYQGKCVFM